MNKPVAAGVGVLAIGLAVAIGVYSTSGTEQADDPTADAAADAPTELIQRTPPSMRAPDGRIRGTRMPDDVRDDLIRHRERIRRAVELGIGTPVEVASDDGDAAPAGEADAMYEPFRSDQEGIQDAVESAVPLIRECVDGYGPEVGPFDGDLAVAFGLGDAEEDEGVTYPSDVTVAGMDVPTAVSSCVTSVFSDLRFIPDSGARSVTYPLNLSFDGE